MAQGINKVILIGNLGSDPEIKFSPNGGAAIANLNVATSSGHKEKGSDKWVDTTEWHRVVMFGRTAEVAGEYLRKGSKVYLEGKLQTNKWQDKDGNDRYTTQVVANQMLMLDSKGADGGQPDRHQNLGFTPSPPSGAPNPMTRSEPIEDDDIPF